MNRGSSRIKEHEYQCPIDFCVIVFSLYQFLIGNVNVVCLHHSYKSSGVSQSSCIRLKECVSSLAQKGRSVVPSRAIMETRAHWYFHNSSNAVCSLWNIFSSEFWTSYVVSLGIFISLIPHYSRKIPLEYSRQIRWNFLREKLSFLKRPVALWDHMYPFGLEN